MKNLIIFTFTALLLILPSAKAASLADVSSFADKNKTSAALKTLNSLKIAPDLKDLTAARIYFQRAELEKAISVYSKIPKSSEYWFEAMEETAHAFGRQGKYSDAIATLDSVIAEPFEYLTGPEPYFISALTSLKICAYSDVLKISQKFKDRFKPRIAVLENIATGKSNAGLDKIRTQLATGPLSFEITAKHINDVPRNLHRDAKLIKNPKLLDARAKALAKSELKEISHVVAKMQIIEAEILHRVHLAEKSKNRETQGQIPKGSDLMTFPKNDDEVWIDEIGSYAAEIEKCPSFKKQVSL